LIEQLHDANGIVWPYPVAPYHVHIVPVNMGHEPTREPRKSIYGRLLEGGVEVLLDDRDERPGAKFKDADLIGVPLRVTIGERGLKDGVLELRDRRRGIPTGSRSARRGGVPEAGGRGAYEARAVRLTHLREPGLAAVCDGLVQHSLLDRAVQLGRHRPHKRFITRLLTRSLEKGLELRFHPRISVLIARLVRTLFSADL